MSSDALKERKSPHVWTDPETQLFLQLMRGDGEEPGIYEKMKSKKSRRSKAMKDIADEMGKHGFELTAEHCDNKWKSLLLHYRHSASGSGMRKESQWYTDVHELVGDDFTVPAPPRNVAASRLAELRHKDPAYPIVLDPNSAVAVIEPSASAIAVAAGILPSVCAASQPNTIQRGVAYLPTTTVGAATQSVSVDASPSTSSRAQNSHSFSESSTEPRGNTSSSGNTRKRRHASLADGDEDLSFGIELLDEHTSQSDSTRSARDSGQNRCTADRRKNDSSAAAPAQLRLNGSDLLKFIEQYTEGQRRLEEKRMEMMDRHHQDWMELLNRITGVVDKKLNST